MNEQAKYNLDQLNKMQILLNDAAVCVVQGRGDGTVNNRVLMKKMSILNKYIIENEKKYNNKNVSCL